VGRLVASRAGRAGGAPRDDLELHRFLNGSARFGEDGSERW
jgi:hypothetical protein